MDGHFVSHFRHDALVGQKGDHGVCGSVDPVVAAKVAVVDGLGIELHTLQRAGGVSVQNYESDVLAEVRARPIQAGRGAAPPAEKY